MPLTAAHTESIAQRMPFLSRRGDFACSLGAMAKIAISYRRTDSDVTGRIFDRFVQRYGKDSVFRDIDNIPFGIDFRKVVNDALRGSDVLIAIVGPNWRGTRKRGGARSMTPTISCVSRLKRHCKGTFP